MNILVLNGSPKGEYSITLQTMHFLELLYPENTFEVLHIGQKIRSIEKDFTETIYNLEELSKKIEEKITYPMFIKPSNSGSSVGINKAKTKEELEEAIKYASKYDKKILIEQGINGREVECAVLGNEEVIASCIGEVLSAEEFYSFDSKYNNQEKFLTTNSKYLPLKYTQPA